MPEDNTSFNPSRECGDSKEQQEEFDGFYCAFDNDKYLEADDVEEPYVTYLKLWDISRESRMFWSYSTVQITKIKRIPY